MFNKLSVNLTCGINFNWEQEPVEIALQKPLENKFKGKISRQDHLYMAERIMINLQTQKVHGLFLANVESKLKQDEPTADELIVFHDLMQHFSPSLPQILNGSYVRVENDDGDFHQKWSSLKSCRVRISSHRCIEDYNQHGVSGNWLNEFLFGVVEGKNKQKHTFFQMENNPYDGTIKNTLLHAIDTLHYYLFKRNVGPFGYSEYTEKNPLVVKT